MNSIAPRPVKPCDGGVFGALNLLLKAEQKRQAGLALSRLEGVERIHDFENRAAHSRLAGLQMKYLPFSCPA